MVLFCARAARRTCAVAGAALYVGRASRASGLHGQLGARACRRRLSAPKLGSTAACGFCARALSRRRRGRSTAGGASGPRRWTAGLNDRHARAQHLRSRGLLSPLFQGAVAPGGTARASTRRKALRVTPAPRRPAAASRAVKSSLPLPLQGCPRRGLSSKLEAHALTSRRHTLPRGLLPPWWRPPRSSTSGTGSRPTSGGGELGRPRGHHYRDCKAAASASRS